MPSLSIVPAARRARCRLALPAQARPAAPRAVSSRMSAISPHHASASTRSWVMSTTPSSRSCSTVAIASSSAACVDTSSIDLARHRPNSAAPRRRPGARQARCSWPSETSCGKRSRRSSGEADALGPHRKQIGVLGGSWQGASRLAASGSSKIAAPTRRRGSTDIRGAWKTSCTRWRSSRRQRTPQTLDAIAVDDHGPAVGREQHRHDLRPRALARSARADEPDAPARGHRQETRDPPRRPARRPNGTSW